MFIMVSKALSRRNDLLKTELKLSASPSLYTVGHKRFVVTYDGAGRNKFNDIILSVIYYETIGTSSSGKHGSWVLREKDTLVLDIGKDATDSSSSTQSSNSQAQ